MRRKKNRVYPSPEAVSRAPDSRERLRKYSLQSDTERAPLTPVGSCNWARLVVVRGGASARRRRTGGHTDHTRYAHSRGRQGRALVRARRPRTFNLTPVT